ncbi:MAG: N utilization substance protein B [Gallionellales bacterium RIFCSPLOWO2_02_FULL_57_47]|nr:MAG: N utilization substance protein B [Gallionellales bacterium RIFCSPLOWO2_02_FULL_57_47]OGT07940.1 MAG: N utilization substance protein B [Gallionellales bacterium RIFCSPHIGHO2_02_FULL_57_16]
MSNSAAGNEKIKVPNKSPRHRARELALQGVYQWRVTAGDDAQIEKQIHAEKNLGRYDKELFSKLLRGALKQHADLEALLAPYLDRPIAELSHVEFAVLLLGAFELSQHHDVPYKVIINEAVELAKTFGGVDGHKYVNGVLDKLALKVRATEFSARKK